MNTKLKPGYKTSEFWFTLVSFIFSGLYLTGLITENDHKEDLIQETSRGLEAVILIIGQLTVLYRYVKGRTEIKKSWWNSEETTVVTPPKKKSKPKSKPKPKSPKEVIYDSSRISKSRDRKTNK
jgi:hypothetical protein